MSALEVTVESRAHGSGCLNPMSTYRYIVCDVFTDRPLAGNQLAVFTDAREIPEARLQALAREINFSETVFAYPPASGGHARIRIFMPGRELPFAGHPVLGSAFVLGAPLEGDEIRLETGRGIVPVRLQRRGPPDHVRLDEPARPVRDRVRERSAVAARAGRGAVRAAD